MVTIIFTLLYILFFELLKIDLKYYVILISIMIIVYKSLHNIEINIFDVIDFQFEFYNLFEIISAFCFMGYFYLKNHIILDFYSILNFIVFNVFFYSYMFKNLEYK